MKKSLIALGVTDAYLFPITCVCRLTNLDICPKGNRTRVHGRFASYFMLGNPSVHIVSFILDLSRVQDSIKNMLLCFRIEISNFKDINQFGKYHECAFHGIYCILSCYWQLYSCCHGHILYVIQQRFNCLHYCFLRTHLRMRFKDAEIQCIYIFRQCSNMHNHVQIHDEYLNYTRYDF